MVYQGKWNASAVYNATDAVAFNGSTYISLVGTNAGNQPDTSPNQWSLIAAAGAAGIPGPGGATGAPGAAGPAGPVGLTGATGPQGPPTSGQHRSCGFHRPCGPAGPVGPAGPAGLIGPQGIQGIPGPAGPSGATLAPVLRTIPLPLSPFQNAAMATGSCPAGRILAGGYQFQEPAAAKLVFVNENMPASNTEWRVTVSSDYAWPTVISVWFLCTQ